MGLESAPSLRWVRQSCRSLVVELGVDADQYVIADAVRVQAASAPPTDTIRPTASGSASNITSGGGSSQTITVQYSDNVAVNASDIGVGDISVNGPGGSLPVTYLSRTSNSDGTPITGTYQVTAPGGTWDSADNGTYSILVNSSQVSDTSDNFVSGGTVGSFTVNVPVASPTDTIRPTASGSASNITSGGGSSQTITVQYSDNVAVNASDIGVGDISVNGPGGSLPVTYLSRTSNSDGTPITGTYQVTAPGGTWDSADNGTYSILVNSSQVSDTSDNFVSGGTVGSFTVNIPVPLSPAGPAVIIDDGDAGFSDAGFREADRFGYQNDYHYGGVRIGSSATWRFTGLTPGASYNVAATWVPHGNRATDAPYRINGTAPVRVNQEQNPQSDFVESGRPFQSLGTFNANGSGVLLVQLGVDADEYVIADAVRVQAASPTPAAPEISAGVIEDGDNIPGIQEGTDFGSVDQGGSTVSRFYRIQNDGNVTLTLGTPSLPSGYTLTDGLSSSLAPGASDTFTVRLDNAVVGTKSGQIVISNNDSDENPFNFSITGVVRGTPAGPAVIIDDGDAGYSDVGFRDALLFGYGLDYDYGGRGIGGGATWRFTGLAPGASYNVAATWIPHANRATDAPYRINGSAPVRVNQELTPRPDFVESGKSFQSLGSFTANSSGVLVVELGIDANEYVIADAVRVQADSRQIDAVFSEAVPAWSE